MTKYNENRKLIGEEGFKEFKIPVFWECTGFVTVCGKDAEDAYDRACKIEEEDGSLPIPDDGFYIESSFNIEDWNFAKHSIELDYDPAKKAE